MFYLLLSSLHLIKVPYLTETRLNPLKCVYTLSQTTTIYEIKRVCLNTILVCSFNILCIALIIIGSSCIVPRFPPVTVDASSTSSPNTNSARRTAKCVGWLDLVTASKYFWRGMTTFGFPPTNTWKSVRQGFQILLIQ